MKILRYTFLSVLLWVFVFSARAQVPELINDSEFRPDAKVAVDSIYNFSFEEADAELSPWKEKYPNHPLWTLIEGMQFWWKVLSDLEDESHDDQFIEIMKKANYRAGQLLHQQSDHTDGLLIKAICNGYLARHHANRGDWLTSVNYGRKAMQAHKYLMEQQPELPDLKLAEGLKLYYSAYLPEAYPIVKTVSWAMPSGDKKKGLDLIAEASEDAIFARAEATYFLGNININYENNYEAATRNLEKLHNEYPQNNYYARILVKSYFQQRKYQKALNTIEQVLKNWEEKDLSHSKVLKEELLTWKGRIYERQGDKDSALDSFREAFENSSELPDAQGRSFFVASGYHAGKLLFDQQQKEEAKYYLTKVSKAEIDNGYRDRAKELLSKIK